MPWPDPVVLTGDHAKLEPLQREHRDALIEAVKDGGLWNLWYTFVPAPDEMDAEIERRLGLQAQGSMLPFTVHNAVGKIVGMTTFMNIDATHKRVEIGSTWYARSVQRAADAIPKASSCCRVMRSKRWNALPSNSAPIGFNHQSGRAIEKLGAKQDGSCAAIGGHPTGRARHRGVLDHRERMADGTGASDLSTRQGALAARLLNVEPVPA